MQNFGLNRSIRHLDVRKTQRLTGLAETLIHKPVESGARIRLAKRRDHGMTRDIFDGIGFGKRVSESRERFILHSLVGRRIRAFELHANREIVAVLTALERGNAGVPGSVQTGNVLEQASDSVNKEVRRNTQPF